MRLIQAGLVLYLYCSSHTVVLCVDKLVVFPFIITRKIEDVILQFCISYSILERWSTRDVFRCFWDSLKNKQYVTILSLRSSMFEIKWESCTLILFADVCVSRWCLWKSSIDWTLSVPVCPKTSDVTFGTAIFLDDLVPKRQQFIIRYVTGLWVFTEIQRS